MTVAIILAAGSSTRFGSAKQLAEVDGEPLVKRAVRCAVEANMTPFVVVGANADAVAPVVDGHRIIRNDDWQDGMGTSIAAGVRAAMEVDAVDVVVMPIDVPALKPADLVRLVEARRRARADAAAATYEDVTGIPACFGPSCYATLMSLSGDEGARQWLRGGDWKVATVPIARAADDVDEPADLETRQG